MSGVQFLLDWTGAIFWVPYYTGATLLRKRAGKSSNKISVNEGHFDAPPVARSDGTQGISLVHLLPHHRPTDAKEIPEVAEDSAVKGVLLVATVLQVGDPVTRHELPGGAVSGHQVEVAAQQHHHHHRENANNSQHRQQEPVQPEPQFPRDAGRDARPEK